MSGSGLVLTENGNNALAVGTGTTFTFPTPLASGASYQIAVLAYIAQADTNTVSAYSLDANTGKLTASASPAVTDTQPTAVAVDPSGRFAYTANAVGENVSAFTLDRHTGALTAVSGAPFDAGVGTQAIAIIGTIQ